jgi:hypothetical protein
MEAHHGVACPISRVLELTCAYPRDLGLGSSPLPASPAELGPVSLFGICLSLRPQEWSTQPVLMIVGEVTGFPKEGG